MSLEQSRAQEQFSEIVDALLKTRGVTYSKPGSRLFGSSALKVHDKIFAMVSSTGEFVVKLPKARVDALVSNGVGNRFDANRGRPMKEWLEVRSQSPEDWLQLAREALDFVGT
jgi:TfoX/Sxy family transcriptional regulator of competence genes